MVLSKKFQSQSEAIASFDAQELASGLGIVHFYCFSTTTGSTVYNIGTSADIRSSDITIAATNTTYTFNSSSFNLPRVAKGTAFVNLTRYSDGTNSITYAITLQRVDVDGNVTDIASAVNGVVATADMTTLAYRFPLTQTLFKVGDNLRLKLVVTGKAANTIHFGLDPSNRTAPAPSGITPSTFDLYMPFLIT